MKSQKFKKTEIGKIPEDWEKLPAEEFCIKVTDGTHDSPKKQEKGKYLVTSRHIKEGKLDFDNAYFISEKDFEEVNKRSKVNQWDLIFGMIGTIGEIYLEKKENPDYAIKNVGLFKTGSELKSKWLFYFLKSPFAKDYIFRHSAGTTQQYMTLGSLRNFPILFPKSKEEQHSIAKILSSLDEKIELNNKMNKTLEEIGQAIFKKWFIDNPEKEGWELSTIGKELKTILGGTPSRVKPEYWNGNINWINSGKVNEFRIIKPSETITEEGLRKSATSLLPKGTVVLAITGATLGQVSRLEINSCANQSVIGVLENEKFSSPYVYYWIKNKIWDIVGHQTGGAQQHINKGNVDNYELLIPDEQTLKDFNKIAEPIFKQISINCFQNQTLSQIRDALLPKLMSGEIRVPMEGK